MTADPAPARAFIRLAPSDNVLVAIRALRAGEKIDGLVIARDIPLGHKVAARSIAPGEKVIKWGAPIGSATRAIAPGELVHLDEMKSDYLPTYTLEAEHRFVQPAAHA